MDIVCEIIRLRIIVCSSTLSFCWLNYYSLNNYISLYASATGCKSPPEHTISPFLCRQHRTTAGNLPQVVHSSWRRTSYPTFFSKKKGCNLGNKTLHLIPLIPKIVWRDTQGTILYWREDRTERKKQLIRINEVYGEIFYFCNGSTKYIVT